MLRKVLCAAAHDARPRSRSSARVADGRTSVDTFRPVTRQAVLVTRAVFLAACLGLATMASPALAQQIPASPSPVAVSLDPTNTAVLVLDITTQTCGSQPRCQEFLPRVAS